jgi:hypothetical protein
MDTMIRFFLVVAGAAIFAVLGVFLNAKRKGIDPSDCGPRSLVSEFLGDWIYLIFFYYSFKNYGTPTQWVLFGTGLLGRIDI